MGEHDAYANPLLLDWIKEWLDKERERNTRGVTAYKNAYESLKACPITFKHPQQLQQLKGFGEKLSSRLVDRLKKHCEQNGLPMPKNPRLSRNDRAAIAEGTAEGDQAGPSRPKKPRKPKAYVPAYRSGAYALVLALSTLDEDSRTALTKAELIELAQEHCDSSFTAPSDPTKFYTAWNSMKTLLDKELVYERGRPLRRYTLTEEGWEVASRIRQTQIGLGSGGGGGEPSTASRAGGASSSRSHPAAGESAQPPLSPPPPQLRIEPPDPDELSNPTKNGTGTLAGPGESGAERSEAPSAFGDVVAEGSSSDTSLPSFTPITLAPGTFTVHLLLDVREIRARTDRDYLQDELTKKGVKPIMRALGVGDAQWIAKTHDPAALTRHGAESDEVVLDWIVERKRLDDLVSSIKDGRFHEQKFRLRKSGVKNVVYVIEEIAMDAGHFQKYEEAVQSAIASTQVVNGYFVKKTQKMDDTIRYLARMTALLKKLYEGKSLLVIPTRVLTAQNYLPLLKHLREKEPDRGYYISYPAFASLASKSDMMTLADVYLKMLMTTRGVTGEKALEIQKRWKTPYEFVKAFERCGGGVSGGQTELGKKRKVGMVMGELSHLAGRKKIPKATSQKIAEVWGDAG